MEAVEWKCLERLEIMNKFCMVQRRIRINTKLVEKNGKLTEINEPGCEIDKADLVLFDKEIAKLKNVTVVITGSIPKRVPKDYYAHIIDKVKAQGNKVLLDADGGA